MKLQAIPKAPQGVKYALTVPQSVLFADLSLQGSKREYFKQAMQVDYAPEYILIDADGAMSWNYDNDTQLNKSLLKDDDLADAINHFVATMERTARQLNKVSKFVESSYLRRGKCADIAEDLNDYWDAYKAHMTSLFTFWNVEQILSNALTAELEAAGKHAEVRQGLARFLKPNEPNYFVLERLQLQKIAQRFASNDEPTDKNASPELQDALKIHRDTYGFLLAPFNLDSPPSIESLIERLKQTPHQQIRLSDIGQDTFDDLPLSTRKLAILAGQLTFWKTERLDMFAFADARAHSLYTEAAKAISLSLTELFALTSQEIIESLKQGSPIVGAKTIQERQTAYCLALIKDRVNFYEPTKPQTTKPMLQAVGVGTTIQGVCASAGKVAGKVRLIKSKKDLEELKPGEILVTKMTRPEYGAALDHAAAFVTDEGGMMCHAAIISREMKKPCVIGTGNATGLLNNGMSIEVDADNGTITILAV